MNALLDENLSPALVRPLASKGINASHIAHVGMAGARDQEVWAYAFEHDQFVVTLNESDFLTLAADAEIHPGIIVLRPGRGLTRDEQWTWLEPVIDEILASSESLVNRAIIVTGIGKFTRRDLPSR